MLCIKHLLGSFQQPLQGGVFVAMFSMLEGLPQVEPGVTQLSKKVEGLDLHLDLFHSGICAVSKNATLGSGRPGTSLVPKALPSSLLVAGTARSRRVAVPNLRPQQLRCCFFFF